MKMIEKHKGLENKKIPADIDYDSMEIIPKEAKDGVVEDYGTMWSGTSIKNLRSISSRYTSTFNILKDKG